MSISCVDRRRFIYSVMGGALGISSLSAREVASARAAEAPEGARADVDDLRITKMSFLRLCFPGQTPRKRNSIIESGGGSPGMTQLEIHTNQGLVGRSMPSGSKLLESVFSKVKGENPFHVERIWDRMYRYNRKPVAKGEYIAAMGSIDMAIWDLIGKALGLPVYKVLGVHNEKIRVYAAGGYYSDGKTVGDLVEEMTGYVREGFPVRAPPPTSQRRHFRATRLQLCGVVRFPDQNGDGIVSGPKRNFQIL